MMRFMRILIIEDDREAAEYLVKAFREQGHVAEWKVPLHDRTALLSDNGPGYLSHVFGQYLRLMGIQHIVASPYHPQTNGKIERFHRILLEEWAYIRPWNSDRQRTLAYDGFIHFYNHHRAHGALGWSTPAATLNTFRDNLPEEHN